MDATFCPACGERVGVPDNDRNEGPRGSHAAVWLGGAAAIAIITVLLVVSQQDNGSDGNPARIPAPVAPATEAELCTDLVSGALLDFYSSDMSQLAFDRSFGHVRTIYGIDSPEYRILQDVHLATQSVAVHEGLVGVTDDVVARSREGCDSAYPSVTSSTAAPTSSTEVIAPQGTLLDAASASSCPSTPTERIGGQQAAICLLRAVRDGDVTGVEPYATAEAFQQAQQVGLADGWRFDACYDGAGSAYCVFLNDAVDGQIEALLGGGPSSGNFVTEVSFYGE